MNPSSESYGSEALQDNLKALQPLDLKKSLRIRDGLVLSSPKSIEGHIMQYIQDHLNQCTVICYN